MKRSIICVRSALAGMAAALALTSLAACSAGNTLQLGQEKALAVGDEVAIKNAQLQIKLLDVLSDSRCPTGATCVWQGEVTCSLLVTLEGSAVTANVTQQGLSDQPGALSIGGYRVEAKVNPYPEVGKQIPKSTYRAVVKVTRGS